MRNAVATSVLVAALALGGAACDGSEPQEPQRSPTGTTASPTKQKPSSPKQTATEARRTATYTPTPVPTGTAASTPNRAPTSTPRWAPTSTPSSPAASTPAPSLTGREGAGTFTPGSEQSTLDDWRRGQCEDAGYTNCE